jgi:Uma2 family endonuclease
LGQGGEHEQSTIGETCGYRAAPQKWTCAEFEALIIGGHFQNRRVEPIEGEILEMSPMLEPHAIAIMHAQDFCYGIFHT